MTLMPHSSTAMKRPSRSRADLHGELLEELRDLIVEGALPAGSRVAEIGRAHV